MSLCPVGIVTVNLEIHDKQFEHTVNVCHNLQQPLLLGMDFAQNYRIDIDWGQNNVSYLRHKGRKVKSVWPSSTILDSETSHVTDANMILVTDGLGVRLITPTIVTIPPHMIVMIPLEPPLRAIHCKIVNAELFEIIGNPLSSLKQSCLLILHTHHKFDTRYPEQYVVIVVNVGDEDIFLNKV